MMAEQRKIRVLMTSPSSDMGGAEKTFWFLSSRLKADKKYEIYGAFPRGSLYPKLKANFKKTQALFLIEFIPRGVNPLSVLRWPLYLITLALNFLLCLKEILLNQIDIIYVNSSIQLSAVLAARLTNRKLMVFVLEDYYHDNLQMRHWLFSLLSRSADLLLCQSGRLENDLKSYGAKVKVIYAGVYEIEGRPSELKSHDPRFFNVGIIGKIYPLKGQATVIAALERLVREGLPIKVHILGGYRRFSNNYFYYRKLKRLVENKGLIEKVVFEEPASLSQIYLGLDAVVIASRSEGFSLVYPEALKYGRPVIATCTGVMADVGKEGENLMFFDYGDDQHLAEKIKLIYSNKELRSKLAQNGYLTYRKYFQEDLIGQQFISEINEVANAHRN